MRHIILLFHLMLGAGLLQAQIRFIKVDPTNDVFAIKNFGSSMVDVSGYRLCSKFVYAPGPLSALTLESGSLMLGSGDTVMVSGFAIDDAAADVGLYLPTGAFSDPNNMVDFMQYGSAGNGRESVAAAKGIWTAGQYIMGEGPYTFVGGGEDLGAGFWINNFMAEAEYVAELSGSQEVLPVMTMGSGKVYLDLTGDTLKLMGHFGNLRGEFNPNVAGGSHIHMGYAGQNGGIQIELVPTLDADLHGGIYEMVNNTFGLTPEQKTALQNRQMYVNIHTTVSPPGEIRGQILPNTAARYMTNLFGSNEVPSRISEGSGALALDLLGDQLTVTGAFMNLDGEFNENVAGGAHLHLGMAGENGGIDLHLHASVNADGKSGVFEADSNTFTLTQDQMMALRARNYYANIHTTKYAPGEIRGQVGKIAKVRFRAHLSGSNEVPVVNSMGTGEVLLELVDSMLMVSGSFQHLSSDFNENVAGGAHLHMGYAGRNGGIAFHLEPTLGPDNRSGKFEVANNIFVLDSAQMMALMGRQFYVNIHTQKYPSGELRGQVLPEGAYFFNAFLSGTNQVTPVLTTGLGGLKAEIRGGKMVVSGSFMNLGSEFNENVAGGAHLHLAMAGSNGPIKFHLHPTLDTDGRSGVFEAANNVFDLSDGMKDTLKARGVYANIHTNDNRPGEIRGQLLHEATLYFNATLSGSSQPKAVNSTGHGAIMFELTGDQLMGSGSFADLSSDFNPDIAGGSHIHGNFAGLNGGILFHLHPDLAPDNRSGKFALMDNTFTLTPGMMDSLKSRMLYVNIHTADYNPGEIRGQILPQAMAYFTTTMAGKNEVQPVSSTGSGALKLELNGNRLTLTGGFENLTGEFNHDIAGGSHLHMGQAGMNGGIQKELHADVAPSGKMGVYQADSNTYMLTEDQLTALMNGMLYFNLHSTEYAPGELRGQILPESNFFPSDEATIMMPADGMTIEIAGNPDSLFMASWTPASEPDGNILAYHWQVALDPGFNIIVQDVNVGPSTVFAVNFAEIDTFLMMAGLGIGDTLSLYHRAVATDGSVCTNGMGASVHLVRGVLTPIDPALLNQFEVKLFPSPVQDYANLQIYAPQAGLTHLRVVDMLGRELYQTTWQLSSGINSKKLDFRNAEGGVYMIQLQLEGLPLKTLKLMK
ncbi:MAG: CHRD domain-containing protein [Bacteroidetes bacterium]|nr:MAG: CHRD domain-containing protein [Bacteroidota bacterium]